VSALFGFTARWAWCGQITKAVIESPSAPLPTLSSLDRHIKDCAYAKGTKELKFWWRRNLLVLFVLEVCAATRRFKAKRVCGINGASTGN